MREKDELGNFRLPEGEKLSGRYNIGHLQGLQRGMSVIEPQLEGIFQTLNCKARICSLWSAGCFGDLRFVDTDHDHS